MKNSLEESRRWMAQSENDLQFAKMALKEGFFSQCCFISQQAAEKAVKAVHYKQGVRIVIGHSIFQLIGKLLEEPLTELTEKAKLLDQFYITSRYPNGIPGGSPFEVFTRKQAEEAIQGAELIYQWAEAQIINQPP